jgi:protein-tyrosine phosphatase
MYGFTAKHPLFLSKTLVERLWMTVQVLFVCLGNICRSPMAEAIFQKLVDDAGLSETIEVDSAGTGSWHVGEKAHPGTRKVLAAHGIAYDGRARRVRQQDLFDPERYVIAMDGSNLRDLQAAYGDHPRLFRLLDFAKQTKERDVPDPYYNGNFEEVYQLVADGCLGLLQRIRKQEKI